MNNENNVTRTEQEDKAVDAAFNIMLIFTALLLAFCLGYFIAVNEALALVKTIVN